MPTGIRVTVIVPYVKGSPEVDPTEYSLEIPGYQYVNKYKSVFSRKIGDGKARGYFSESSIEVEGSLSPTGGPGADALFLYAVVHSGDHPPGEIIDSAPTSLADYCGHLLIRSIARGWTLYTESGSNYWSSPPGPLYHVVWFGGSNSIYYDAYTCYIRNRKTFIDLLSWF